jgi:uncharacterized protein Yka (UPF0111/DUF47 family)
MKMDRNYHQALTQVAEKVRDAVESLCAASVAMIAGRPEEAHEHLDDAKASTAGAMVSAKWATTLPDQEDK